MKGTDFKKSVVAAAVGMTLVAPATDAKQKDQEERSEHVAGFRVFLNTDINDETVSGIVAATENVGFVHITSAGQPQAGGAIAMGGEPTAVAVVGGYALVAVNTSPSYVAPSGKLVVIDMAGKSIVTEHMLGGQPVSVAVSPDGRYAAVVIENERDEDLGDGAPPQLPSGFLTIVDLVGAPSDWGMRTASLAGLPDLYPTYTQPAYVDISKQNIAIVTLQENNHIVLVDLESGDVALDFDAGIVNLDRNDVEDDGLISLNHLLDYVLHEPDGASWISNKLFATANAGVDGSNDETQLLRLKGVFDH